ncbi:MAG TPA: Rrf2 family transcriptional regulator [Longimicrobiaceae bacterium]|jgi:Rrf2 family protein
MLSQTAEHALRAVLYLAQRAPGESVAADAIADALGAPRNYLSKTLNALARQGIVSSMRGPTGGFRLAVGAERLTLEEVVRAFDEPRERGACLLGGRPCRDEHPCEAHFRWKAVARDVWEPLRRTTVADLLGRTTFEVEEVGAAGARAGTPRRTAPAVRATERTHP